MKAFRQVTLPFLAVSTALMATGCGHLPTTAMPQLRAASTGTIMAAGKAYKLGFNLALAKRQRASAHPRHLTRQGMLPASADNRDKCAPVYDQGQLGSCTAFSIAKGLREMLQRTEGQQDTPMSALWFYYNERKADGDVSQDAGSTLTTGLNVLSSKGCAPDADDPYDITAFTKAPSKKANSDAPAWKVKNATQLAGLDDIKTACAAGKPVVFGFTVYSSFRNIGKDGMMPMPKSGEQVLGGHAVMVAGYDDAKQVLIVRNSWSASWGDQGYFYMPYKFAADSNEVNDIWTAE